STSRSSSERRADSSELWFRTSEMAYRDELAAAHARIAELERQLRLGPTTESELAAARIRIESLELRIRDLEKMLATIRADARRERDELQATIDSLRALVGR